MTTRVIPPTNGATTRIGRATYTAGPNDVLDVADADALVLSAAGWFIIGTVGPTGTRAGVTPTLATHIDTTLGKPVYLHGSVWKDHAGKPV